VKRIAAYRSRSQQQVDGATRCKARATTGKNWGRGRRKTSGNGRTFRSIRDRAFVNRYRSQDHKASDPRHQPRDCGWRHPVDSRKQISTFSRRCVPRPRKSYVTNHGRLGVVTIKQARAQRLEFLRTRSKRPPTAGAALKARARVQYRRA